MAVPSVTESQLDEAIRSFIIGVMPMGVTVIKGQQNRLPQPLKDFVIFTSRTRRRISTEQVEWFPGGEVVDDLRRTGGFEVIMQVDVYGPKAAENAQVIASLFRSSYACDRFKALVPSGAVQPLHSSDPQQMPLINAEEQYEQRWTMDAHMQANIYIEMDQETAIGLGVEAIYMADREIA